MRLIDFSVAVLGLITLFPIMLIVSFLIKLESKGPALFKQTRIGFKGKPFTCLKFRSMFIDTKNKPTHEMQKSAVTTIGHVLRRTKLDEIPQLINVLKGEMALVGPRPCLPIQDELISARIQSGALEVAPGITGLAQIKGIDMSEPQRLAGIDGHYARTRNICLDLSIIIKTFLHIITSKAPSDIPG